MGCHGVKEAFIQLEFDFGTSKKGRVKVKDNELIGELQKRFFEDRQDEKVKLALWESITNCARRMIFCERKKKGFYLSPDEMDYKATGCTEYIFMQYAKNPGWSMKNPSSYIYLRVLAALYRHKKFESYFAYTDKEL